MTREKAIDVLDDYGRFESFGDKTYHDAFVVAIEALQQPEQKKGKWLSHYGYCKRKGYMPSGLSTFWWCNQCEQGVEHPTNYCPNCGAEMEEEE